MPERLSVLELEVEVRSLVESYEGFGVGRELSLPSPQLCTTLYKTCFSTREKLDAPTHGDLSHKKNCETSLIGQ